MRQRFNPPSDRDDDVVVPDGWAEMAKEHWRVFLPTRYAGFVAEGTLEAKVAAAAHLLARGMREAMEHGVSEAEAWSALCEEHLLLPSEDEQPDPRSLNLDGGAVRRALTRACQYCCDDGMTDYAAWVAAMQKELQDEVAPHLEATWHSVTGAPPHSVARTVTWNMVRNTARRLFHIWVGQPELKWVREAWVHLRDKGLTSYHDELERSKVLVRLGTLHIMYREFCDLAFGQGDDSDGYWDDRDLDPLILAQLFPRKQRADPDEEEEADDDEGFTEELQELSRELRPEIYDALFEGFGGETGLFISLWRTPTENDPIHQESEAEIVSDVTADKLEAFSWIRGGMYVLH
jgi:hypothetical protein